MAEIGMFYNNMHKLLSTLTISSYTNTSYSNTSNTNSNSNHTIVSDSILKYML